MTTKQHADLINKHETILTELSSQLKLLSTMTTTLNTNVNKLLTDKQLLDYKCQLDESTFLTTLIELKQTLNTLTLNLAHLSNQVSTLDARLTKIEKLFSNKITGNEPEVIDLSDLENKR